MLNRSTRITAVVFVLLAAVGMVAVAQGPAAAQVVADDLVRLPAEEGDVRPGPGPQPLGVLAAADDHQPPPQ